MPCPQPPNRKTTQRPRSASRRRQPARPVFTPVWRPKGRVADRKIAERPRSASRCQQPAEPAFTPVWRPKGRVAAWKSALIPAARMQSVLLRLGRLHAFGQGLLSGNGLEFLAIASVWRPVVPHKVYQMFERPGVVRIVADPAFLVDVIDQGVPCPPGAETVLRNDDSLVNHLMVDERTEGVEEGCDVGGGQAWGFRQVRQSQRRVVFGGELVQNIEF